MKTLRTIGALAVTGTVLALLPISSAMAAEVPQPELAGTEVTYQLTAGKLTITAPNDEVTLVEEAGSEFIAGSLPTVTIADGRRSQAGWTVSAASSAFEDEMKDATITYSSGEAAEGLSEGVVTAATSGAKELGETPVEVLTGTAAEGINQVSFTPTLTVDLPKRALAKEYTGTITTSVL